MKISGFFISFCYLFKKNYYVCSCVIGGALIQLTKFFKSLMVRNSTSNP